MQKFNKQFDKIYEKNSKKGYKIIEKMFNQLNGNLENKIKKIIIYISEEIDKLYEHK